MPNEDGEIEFRRFEREGDTTQVDCLKHDFEPPLVPGPRVGFWGEPDYDSALETLAESMGIETADCARKFGVLDLAAKGVDNGWHYHPALGFSRKK